MPPSHKHTASTTQNHKAQLANAYNELGKELSSTKLRVIGNYTLGKVIGEGAYGKVRLGTHRLTSTRVAIKQIPKAMSSSLTREIHHHRQLHHPHVTQMYEVIATESSIWIVTELCCGGELFDYLVEKGRLNEDETRIIFGQLCLAVAYLHEKGIVHRDLKLENVLLDERCRVKLGDFGFTREFERGAFMETFCGTTGYASPEMLQGKKYQGPEVDIWSLGIILYCLLTGTLPFDDDEESVMRDKIIQGEFEDPEWLSSEARDLIKNILQQDPSKRLTIPQILVHPWFTPRQHSKKPSVTAYKSSVVSLSSDPPSPVQIRRCEDSSVDGPDFRRPSEVSTQSAASDSTFKSTSSDFDNSAPTTPDDLSSNDPFIMTDNDDRPIIHKNPSEITLRTLTTPGDLDILQSKFGRSKPSTQPTVMEEDQEEMSELVPPLPITSQSSSSSNSKAPPAHPVRTPARTKRRSVSSTLSEPTSPTADKSPLQSQSHDLDFASLLNTPSPIIFSTPLERELLNSLSLLGFDTGQIVHSVLSDACDSAGAVWWMMKKKAEKKELEEAGEQNSSSASTAPPVPDKEPPKGTKRRNRVNAGVQTDSAGMHSHFTKSAPQLAFVPPTPTFAKPPIPQLPTTPTRSSMLSPTPSTVTGESSRSHPPTPASSQKDKDSKGRKGRAGSVSIMQRATTALEAAGLVRKKSTEAIRERARERSREAERRHGPSDEPRSSHGSSSSKLTKSPPNKPPKDHNYGPTTPPPRELLQTQPNVGSPWVLAGSPSHKDPHVYAPTPANSPGELHPSASAPNFSEPSNIKGPHRNRASILSAFRLWFNEDRKGKRKEIAPPSTSRFPLYGRPVPAGSNPAFGKEKRRRSGSGSGRFPTRGHRPQRASISSRRSSSVNSRRSSGASMQMVLLDSPQIPTRRSFGSHTPNSERGEYSSRPSSVRSFSMHRHRKSPSASSAGSARFRTASPMQKYHRRAGSGSSTRVVRQVQTTPSRPPHVRSNSAASSVHSPPSSRPASWYDPSDCEIPRTTSPMKYTRRSQDDSTPRRHSYTTSTTTTFVAQKKQGPFISPVPYGGVGSIGRSSWKKSWGLEPPGWKSRSTHLPVEVLAISTGPEGSGYRDVISGRQSLNLGDESDWVDEDDDIPAFAGGLGQMSTGMNANSTMTTVEPAVTLAAAPRGHRSSSGVGKRTGNRNIGSSGSSRQKSGHSPVERASPIPMESSEPRGGRRQLPTARPGPAFRGHAIQEEDEDEE